MSVELKNNKFLTYFLVLISLFIIILFTSGQFSQLQENKDTQEELEKELMDVRAQQETLQNIKKEITQSWALTQRYLQDFTENEIIDYLYTYQEASNNASGNLQITSINLSQETQNDFGFFEKTVDVDIVVSSQSVMIGFLDYLVAEDAKYRFFVESFTFPNDAREWGYNVSLPLKIFYR